MAPRPRWWHSLQASKNEVRLAVDLYNRSGEERQLEAFIVHMSMGWLKLLQAHFEKTNRDIVIRDKRGWRVKHEDGGYKHRSLRSLIDEHFDPNDARRANINLFIGLRNQIEHRHEKSIAAFVAGRTQAHLLNYETTLVECFGTEEGVASELRFPLFLSSITDDAVATVKKIREQVPRGVLEWVQDFDTSLESDVRSDQSYDFRVYLVPHTGPKTDADASMTFVRSEDLTDEQNQVVDQFRTIIRDKKVPVSDLDTLLPNKVVKAVAARIAPTPFSTHLHTQAWNYFSVRPMNGAEHPHKTKADFCRYNETFKQYVYTQEWVNYLVRHMSDADTYLKVKEWKPDWVA